MFEKCIFHNSGKEMKKIVKLVKIPVIVLFLIIFYETNSQVQKEIEILLNQRIPMRNGSDLSARIWKPANVNNKLPAILWFTPYVSDEQQTDGSWFASQGYCFVSVDVRGRGDSNGEFLPLEADGRDGAQVVQWIATQPWCDGRVVMMGGSYRGMVQWQTLRELPPSLKAIAPSASVGPGIDYPAVKNIFYSFTSRWLAFVSEATSNAKLFGDVDYWSSKFYNMHSNYLPFMSLDTFAGANAKIFRRWLSHPTYDKYWKDMVPQPEDFAKFNIPILTITGHFDDDQNGAMYYYKQHFKYASELAKEKHFLVIGPYDHGGTRRPKKELEGLTFGDNSVIDMNKLQLEFFDWVLKDNPRPKFLEKQVACYVMGDNTWKYADRIEELAPAKEVLYFSSTNEGAGDVFHSGVLSSNLLIKQNPDFFNYDPLKIVNRESYLKPQPNIYTDQSSAFADDVLVYHTQPLENNRTICGYVKFRAYLEANVPDADFSVSLYEIKSNGNCIFLGNDIIRARYRNSLEKAELLKPGEINLYEFASFPFFCRTLNKGSRIRLVLGCLNSPEYEKNYCSGGAVELETKKDARKALIKFYHDEQYPSSLELPVGN
ncbi:MAG: putative hydrolase CocE/NonD family protein precursor [Ignavibacteria bacterium]|nr:putative hydrolase CocE/NonD family protein precursor [Ignavibacteria bacterium]